MPFNFQSAIIIFLPWRVMTSFCFSRIFSSSAISAGITTDKLRFPTLVTFLTYFFISLLCYAAYYAARFCCAVFATAGDLPKKTSLHTQVCWYVIFSNNPLWLLRARRGRCSQSGFLRRL